MKVFIGLLSLVCLVSSCTDPTYGEKVEDGAVVGACTGRCDAGAGRDGKIERGLDEAGKPPVSEAGVQVEPGGGGDDAMVAVDTPLKLPAGTENLLGKYAVRARFYAVDVPNKSVDFAHNLVMLAEIRPDPTRQALEMHVKLCEDVWTLVPRSGFAPSTSRIVHPDYYPERTYALRYEQGHFYTSLGVVTAGYDANPPSPCTGVSSDSQKQWQIDGKCDCSKEPLPTTEKDCRVIDSDQDKRAAMTVEVLSSVPGSSEIQSAVRVRDNSQFLAGTIDNDKKKHTAQYRKDEDYLVFCSETSGDFCQNSSYAYCPPALQPALFEPLTPHADGSDWTCDDALAQRDGKTLFDQEPLLYPTSGC